MRDDLGAVDRWCRGSWPCSRSAGTRMYASSPAAAALAATLFGQVAGRGAADGLEAELAAFDSATATTRSLNDSVGKLTASFLIHSFSTPSASARRSARIERRAADVRADGRLAVDAAAARGTATCSAGGPSIFAAAEASADGVVVVVDFERAEVVGAEVERLPWGRACRRGDTSGPARVLQTPAFSLRRRPGSPPNGSGTFGPGTRDERQPRRRRRSGACSSREAGAAGSADAGNSERPAARREGDR